MTSPKKSVRFAPDLEEAIELRRKALKYRNFTAYIIGLVRYDLLVQGDHSLTLPYANLSDVEQDQLNAKLLALTKRGKGERGSLLKRLLDAFAKDGTDLKDALLAL
jgi:hypothetical protein